MTVERVKAAVAANREVPQGAPTPFQDCSDEVHIALFFDGTGNNREADNEKMKWSNVARLYEAAVRASLVNKNKTIHPIYVPGVGTDFTDSSAGWLGDATAWLEDNVWGAAAGSGGDRRMESGQNLVNDHLRDVLIAKAKMLGGIAAKHAAGSSQKSLDDVNAALAKHRLIRAINLSIFGFSRGAALARAFSNRLIAKCSSRNGALYYAGYPLRMRFMGLFDTVASFGVPAQNVRTPFSGRELIVSPLVERCVHYVAAHELRFSFPVDLIRLNGKLAGDWIEKVFPGAHSDVGGGYAPGEQQIDNNYARVPMREMMKEALLCGVRILSYDELKGRYGGLFKERFECKRETEAAYARYMEECKPHGTVEQQIIAHMKLYYSANGTMSRMGKATARDRSRRGSMIKAFLGPRGMAAEVAACRSDRKNIRLIRFGGTSSRAAAQYVEIRQWQLKAWDTTAKDVVVDFVSGYVHDSKVDFLFNAEPFSYFRPRGVDESSISVWEEGGNWLRSKGRAVSEAMNAAWTSAEEQARQVADATTEGVKAAVDVAQREVRKVADEAYEAATDTGREAVDAVNRTVDGMKNQAEAIYENGRTWVRRKLEEV